MRITITVALLVLPLAGPLLLHANEDQSASSATQSVDDGTLHVPAFDLPMSDFLSAESRAAFAAERRRSTVGACFDQAHPAPEEAMQKCRAAEEYVNGVPIEKLKARYPVIVKAGTTGGVSTTIIPPDDGVSPTNRHRVLIDVAGPDLTD